MSNYISQKPLAKSYAKHRKKNKTQITASIILEIIEVGAVLITLSTVTLSLALLLTPVAMFCIFYKYKIFELIK
ncbi:MAG: hypothetical protein F6K40_34430 [Okeania sp. SIO3I5]|uniref:hypothetical protein n=1 Tax=Okeania sp. SIO3I5 TaxID=2607805 RepID=UPI0013B7ABB0|nr:hypothetical protein [Okeania sp. SIO3I5]NEQ41036.1 hypothetical protein [Okeania sp. SIO3I5]